MLDLVGVSKTFGPNAALHPIDLKLPPGRTRPDTGTISFDGKPITLDNVLQVRRRIGYVIQDGGLFPHLTARGNVTLLARYLGRDGAAIDKRLAELAEL